MGVAMESTGARGAPPANDRPREGRRDRALGFSIIGVAFLGALAISWTSSQAVRPRVAPEPAPPTSEGLPGFPTRVDPVAALARAETLTERNQLRRMLATGVASDGTVDVSQPGSAILFEFDSKRGEGPEAPRPPGTLPKGPYCGRQQVNIRQDGIYADPDQPAARCAGEAREPLPEPRCSLERIWQNALKRGAPVDGRATIEYYRAQGGPAWRFSLSHPSVRFTLYGDCETPLTGAAARTKN